MKTLGTLALIFIWTSLAHGEKFPLAEQLSAGQASDRSSDIIRVQLTPAPHRDIPISPKNPDSRAINNCAKTNNSCEAAKAGLPMTAQEKKGGCCYVDWVDCLNGAGAKDAPPKDDKYAEELEACYSQETPELKEQVLQQCTAQLDEANQKALDTWTPYHERNETVAFSFHSAQSCLDKAQHSCLSGHAFRARLAYLIRLHLIAAWQEIVINWQMKSRLRRNKNVRGYFWGLRRDV